MKKKVKYLIMATVMSTSATGAGLAFAQGSGPTLLDSLDSGLWQFRAVGGGPAGTPVSRLCVRDLVKLAQVQHRNANCEQYVVRSNAATVTISYICSGQGQGLTTIRKESNRLVHIDSQGIYNNSPFSFTVEARRSASCRR